MTHELTATYNPLGFDMKGIRPEGCCPKCNKPFKWDNKRGYVCKSHFTKPSRYSVIIYHEGERIVRGTGLDGNTLRTFADAHNLRNQAEIEKKEKRFNPGRWKSKSKIEYSFSALVDKWYSSKEKLMEGKKRAPSYVPKIGTYIRLYFVPCYKDMDVRGIFNLDEFDSLLPTFVTNDKRRIPLSPKYQKNLLDALEAFFRWLLKKKYILELPDFPEPIDVPEHIPITISKETQLKILELIPDEHKPIFTWLFYQGCRPADARALKWDCIDDDIVTYRRGFSADKPTEHTKTKTTRDNYIFYETLQSLPKRGLPNDYVFTHGVSKRHYSGSFIGKIYNKALGKFNEKYGINLRIELYEATKHSFGEQKLKEGYTLYELKEWFGHTKIESTERYAKTKIVDVFRRKQNLISIETRKNRSLRGNDSE